MASRLSGLLGRSKDPPSPAPSPATPAPIALPYGLKVLAESVEPEIDIVAVHGLNGHREITWTTGETNWLRDFLPSGIPSARILSWGYDARTYGTTPISQQYLYDHARTLVSDLCLKRNRTQSTKRPIIFVAHSLGGIIVKSALIHSDGARQGALAEHKSIKLSTYGIIFMGTPHQGGSGVHLAQAIVNVASIFVAADDKILKHLREDSEWLQQQLGQYGPISGDFVTKFAYETLPTPIVAGKSIMIVPKSSAVVAAAADAEPIAIHADHLNMVKFASMEEPGYETVLGHLQIMAEKAPTHVQERWGRHDASGLLHDSVAGSQATTNFVGPGNQGVQIGLQLEGPQTPQDQKFLDVANAGRNLSALIRTGVPRKGLKEAILTFEDALRKVFLRKFPSDNYVEYHYGFFRNQESDERTWNWIAQALDKDMDRVMFFVETRTAKEAVFGGFNIDMLYETN